MFFKKRNTYEMNVDTANAILQNVFAAEDKTPNTLSFDKIVLRQKANTRFYDKILRVLLLVLTLSFLSPLVLSLIHISLFTYHFPKVMESESISSSSGRAGGYLYNRRSRKSGSVR